MVIEPLTPERRRQQTRGHLLQAAAQVFAERGFYGATLDEVAAVAGFTKGAVYSNFKNKEDLFLALFKANSEREMAALEATLESDGDVPPEDRLGDFVELIQRGVEGPGTNLSLLYQEFELYAARNPSAREQLVALEHEFVEAVARILTAERARMGIEPKEPPAHSALLVEILFRGISRLRVLDPEAVDDALIEAAINFVTRALGASTD